MTNELAQSQETKEQVVFVPNQVAEDLSKAAGGLVGVEVTKLGDDEKQELVEDVKNYDSDLEPGVAGVVGKASRNDDLDQQSFVKVSTPDNGSAAEALTDNLVGLTVGTSESQTPQDLLKSNLNRNWTESNMHARQIESFEDGLESGADHTPEVENQLNEAIDSSKAKLAQTEKEQKVLNGVDQVVKVVGRSQE
jgi:hypothetical protein